MAKKVRITNEMYWRDRMAQLAEDMYELSDGVVEDINDQFKAAADEMEKLLTQWYVRLADNNGLSYTDAMKLLQSDELEEFHWTVEQYIKAGKENAIDQRWMKELENASAKVHIRRLEAIRMQIRQQAEMLAAENEKATADHLQEVYTEKYYRDNYELSRNLGIGVSFSALDEEAIHTALYTPWADDGTFFSERIWNNRDKLVRELHKTLSQGVITGKSIQNMTRDLRKRMDTSRSNAERIVRTETAAIMSKADKAMYDDLGVKWFEINATLDMKTCAVCGDMDHLKFPKTRYEIGVSVPPYHPNCRCCTVPAIDDDFAELLKDDERAARDENGKYIRVPADMSYKDWKERFVNIEKEKNANKGNPHRVDKKYIRSAEYRNKFYSLADNKDLAEALYKKANDILLHRNGSDMEDLHILNVNTGEVVASQTHSSTPYQVDMNDSIVRAVNRYKAGNVLVGIHNHPNNHPPSGGDFAAAFRRGYRFGIVVCHDGTAYRYSAGNGKMTGRLFDLTVEKYHKRGYNIIEAYDRTLEELGPIYGIKWEKY